MRDQRLAAVAALLLSLAGAVAGSATTWQRTEACAFQGIGGDLVDRGFYLKNYPGNNLSQVQLGYTAGNGGGGLWSIRLTAHRTSYDGPVLGSTQIATVNVPETSTGKEILVIFDFGGAPVTPGDTIAFTHEAQRLAGATADLFFDTGAANCPGIFETTSTNPPLDTPRGNGMGIVVTQQVVTGACIPSDTVMCIDDTPGDRRFKVTAIFHTTQDDGIAGNGEEIPLAAQGVTHGGLLWFFGSDNPEMLVKLVNGCAINGHHWVFLSPATNVAYTLLVRDTKTGSTVSYQNPDLNPAPPIQDTGALPCP